jgi:hypothetical protein
MNAPTQTAEVARADLSSMRALQMPADQAVDMFTERGFALACRIAKALASSDAVPVQYRQQTIKKVGRQEQVVENPAALGNCLVAVEVARAVGMSIVSVMQNADMIEGKLRWSGKFVIAAVNASGRFTPLRFDMKQRGRMKASYKEKTGWDEQINRPIMTERTVEVDDIQCIAWALPKGMPFPPGIYTLDQAKAAGLPVIEGAPVTMKLVVEEGWYGKPGSKWQTDMRTMMFQYRAGTFFANIHAPDVIMGMGGQTSEEARDLMTVDMGNDGQVLDVRPDFAVGQKPPMAEVVPPASAPAPASSPAPSVPENAPRDAQKASPVPSASASGSPAPTFDAEAFADRMERAADAGDIDTMDAMADELRGLADQDLAGTLTAQYKRLRASAEEMRDGQGSLQAAPPTPAPAPAPAPARRGRAAGANSFGSLE